MGISSFAMRRGVDAALDILLPPLCLSCDAAVASHQTLCAVCWGQIHFITPPFCSSCGMPFEVPVGDGMLCAACLSTPPVFVAARSAMLYDDASKKLILGFKHGDRTHPAKALAGWMYRAAADIWASVDVIIPVPLHRWRLFRRRYNQAALLAQGLHRFSGKPVWVDGLTRQRATPVQGHMKRIERQKNVKGAFVVHTRYEHAIAGKNIVVIDDVVTTGATINECSTALLEAGAHSVKALTLARVRGYS